MISCPGSGFPPADVFLTPLEIRGRCAACDGDVGLDMRRSGRMEDPSSWTTLPHEGVLADHPYITKIWMEDAAQS